MYLHLGQNVVINGNDVIAILDMENTSISRKTRTYLAAAQKQGDVVNVCSDLPKSFVVCQKEGRQVVYITQISSQTLRRRAGAYYRGLADAGVAVRRGRRTKRK